MKTPIILLCLAPLVAAADFRAGVAKVDITPKTPIWMAGYADRTHPSEGVLHPLWAKALAIEDRKRGRVVIVTTDLIGLPRSISDAVAARALKEYDLDRARLLLNSSHTHTGPIVAPNLPTMFALDSENAAAAHEYSRTLTEALFQVIGGALGDLAPAELSYGHGETKFAINRRQQAPQGMRIGVNANGPVDHDVPVLKITGSDGKLRAVLFGYACHNTTLTGQFYRLSGDYSGFAQIALENTHPGATALFVMLCGADQNPNPRSKLELAEQHGQALAAEVDRVLAGPVERIKSPIRAAFQNIELEFAPHTRATFEAESKDKNPAKVRRAERMLKAYDDGRPIRRTAYPVQAIRFNKDLTILALGGEVVIDYDLRVKREYGGRNMIVAGYSNDVMCYIPSKRVLGEGGYEAVDSMIYYGQPGPFSDDVEERIFDAIHQTMKRVGMARARR